MSIEIIILIAILTLLAICLGVSFFWLIVLETTIQSLLSEPSSLELIANFRLQATQLMSVILVVTFICAIALNFISHSRTEPYLLKIGLISFILFLASVLIKFIFLQNSANSSKLSVLNNCLLWANFLCLTVSYWSFLHYALNPKI